MQGRVCVMGFKLLAERASRFATQVCLLSEAPVYKAHTEIENKPYISDWGHICYLTCGVSGFQAEVEAAKKKFHQGKR